MAVTGTHSYVHIAVPIFAERSYLYSNACTFSKIMILKCPSGAIMCYSETLRGFFVKTVTRDGKCLTFYTDISAV